MELNQRESLKVMAVDDERAEGNSIIVTLRYGFRFSADPLCPVHVEGFDTVREARAGIRNAIACECGECAAAI